jgi:hypothetical protein
MNPPFVMSKYASEADLNKAKASYYEQLARTFAANVVNASLSDAEFRQFVGNCLTEFEAARQKRDAKLAAAAEGASGETV